MKMNQTIKFELDTLFKHQFFSNLDYFFARSMAKAYNEDNSIVLSTCALVSKVLFQGHICLNIGDESTAVKIVSDADNSQVKFPDKDVWIKALKSSALVSNTTQTPLVLDGQFRIFFSKYYDFQNRLSQNIANRLSLSSSNETETVIDDLLDSQFSEDTPHDIPQKNAVKHAVLNHFTIISGGPGTGKTSVTTKIKQLFLSYAEKRKLPVPKISCVAPTGKAASKLGKGSTIHSFLKPLKNRIGFYYNKKNLMQIDMIIIDEASMIDILLLTRLLEAIPLTAKVVLLGDKYQLSSIQAGSVFNDICMVSSLSSSLFLLEYNFRSKGKTGIEKISTAINDNNPDLLETVLTSGQYPDLVFENLDSKGLFAGILEKYSLKGFKTFSNAGTTEAALNLLDNFKILCAHNSGEYGTLQINHVCEKILRSDHNFDIQEKFFKQMIMITKNDYKKGLFNGDTGIVYEKNGVLNAEFKDIDGRITHYRYSDLPGSSPAYALTIHKSQGSEFDTVLIVLPDKLSPVMTRQLLYTGVTRAKQKVIIAGNISILKKAISVSIKRNSGLAVQLDNKIFNNERY